MPKKMKPRINEELKEKAIQKHGCKCCICGEKIKNEGGLNPATLVVNVINEKKPVEVDNLMVMCRSCSTRRQKLYGKNKIKGILRRNYLLEYEKELLENDVENGILNLNDIYKLVEEVDKRYIAISDALTAIINSQK